jgi:hypothetical protein
VARRRLSRVSTSIAFTIVLAGAPAVAAAAEAWVRFDDASAVTAAHAIAAAEVPGDASISPLSVEDGRLTVRGLFALDNGSRWATLGAEIAPTGPEAGADMSASSVLRIRLASADPRPLRVRIKGGDREVGNAGCYPVVVQMVTAAAADYVIPLSAFRSPGWCGAKAVSIEQTLHSVQRVEVTANDGPAGRVSFSVGPIDFLAGERQEADGALRLTQGDAPAPLAAPPAARGAARTSTTASAAASSQRRRVAGAAAPASSQAPSRRVVCEHSARYELMLCY